MEVQQSLYAEKEAFSVSEVIHALKKLRVQVIQEEMFLHRKIQEVLTQHNLSFSYEYKLGNRSRVDFFLLGGIAIEVKKGMPNSKSLQKQLSRYCAFEEVRHMIVVVERTVSIPDEINGKPITLISLNKLWGMTI